MDERDNLKTEVKQDVFCVKETIDALSENENIKDVSRRLIERNRQAYEQLAKH